MKYINQVKKFGKKIITSAAVISALSVSALTEINAAQVDFSGGVEQVVNQVTSQGKVIAGAVFAAVAVVCLALTVGKGIKLAQSYYGGHEVKPGIVIASGIGTIVAGLASLSNFFGWFGL